MTPYDLKKEREDRQKRKRLLRAGQTTLDGALGKGRGLIKTLLLFGFAFLIYSWIPLVSVPDIEGVALVLDGDTLEINGQRIRLFGIDAPEGDQRCWRGRKPYACGRDSRSALMEKIGPSKAVSCEQEDIDAYNRIVATCFVEGKDINKWMVEQGQALAYRDYSIRYVFEEREARTARRGLWNSTFQKPWAYRQSQREKEAKNLPSQ